MKRLLRGKFLSDRYESVDIRVRLFLFIVDLFGFILFFPLKILNKFKHYYPQKIRKILILRLDGIGDVVISSAALREIRRGFPEAEITLAVGPWAKQIAECIPFYDRLIVHDSFLFSLFRGNRKFNPHKELNFIKELRKNKYDLGIDLRGDLLSIIPLFLSGAPFRFAKDTRGGGFLLTHVVQWNREKISHEKDKALRLVESLGIGIRNRDTELHIPQKDADYVTHYLTERGVKASDHIITIAPRALYPWRSWRPERFAHVTRFVAKRFRGKIILIGSRDDKNVLDSISTQTGGEAINSAGDLSLGQAAALIGRSTVFIGHDSGLIHIAAALQTPMIQLFGPGEPEKFGYTGEKNIVLMKTDCPYHPCPQRSCKYKEEWCMDNILVDDVTKAFEKLISGGKNNPI